MSAGEGIEPQGEALRHALAWLAQHPPLSLARIEEACQRFNLSPKDEAFLIEQLLHHESATRS